MRGRTFLFSLLFCLACLAGCATQRQGITDHGFFSTGMPNILVKTEQNLTPIASGTRSVTIPAGTNASATGNFAFAAFADRNDKQPARHAHIGLVTLSGNAARFTLEREREADAFLLDKETIDGRYWTVRLLPVYAAEDWFCELRRVNKLPTPSLWLAKRWSWTPDSHTRVVAEYREAAPMCLQRLLPAQNAEGKGKQQRVSRAELLKNCSNDIDDFSIRAEKAFTFTRAGDNIQATPPPSFLLPDSAPDMQKVVGKAEVIGRDTMDFNR